MRNPLGFFVDLLRQPLWIPVWVSWLAAINLLSLRFWDEPLAKLVLATFLLSAMMMMTLYARYGFEKVLGLGHILWLALLPYLLISIPGAGSGFQSYLIALTASISISLAFDVVDVWTYFAHPDDRIRK